MLRFPDHSLPFAIYTDASNYQIWATIKQKGFTVAYFSRKLTPTQRRYPTIEQEMMAIVEVLKEYRNFLLGASITIFTDHKNLLSQSSDNNRVFIWKQKIEEYNVNLKYVKGQNNVEADALSRLPTVKDDNGIEVMLNHPQMDDHNPLLNKYPLKLQLISKYQQLDAAQLKALQEDPRFTSSKVMEISLISYQPMRSERRCIVIPEQLQYTAVRRLHNLLGHVGATILTSTLFVISGSHSYHK